MLAGLFAGLAIFGVMLVWVAVQSLARKADHLPPDCDMLGDTGKECGHCHAREGCTIQHKNKPI